MTKKEYAYEFIHNMGLGDPTTCFYWFIFDKADIDNTHIILYQ